MLGLKKKEVIEEVKEESKVELKEEIVEEIKEEIVDQPVETTEVAVASEVVKEKPQEKAEETPKTTTAVAKAVDKKPKKVSEKGEEVIDAADKFPDLAELMNTTVEQLRDEFYLFQIRKFMSIIGKVIVRYNVLESEVERMFYQHLWKEAEAHLEKYGFWPVFDLCELD